LETGLPSHEDQRKTSNAEEVIPTEVLPEAVIWNTVTVIAATLPPGLMLVLPRTSARLTKSGAHLFLMLRHAAMMYTSVRRAIGLYAPVIGTSIRLLRSCLSLRWPATLLSMILLCWPGLLMLRTLFRSVPLISLILVLGNGSGSEDQT
jgi:hypothetical protein